MAGKFEFFDIKILKMIYITNSNELFKSYTLNVVFMSHIPSCFAKNFASIHASLSLSASKKVHRIKDDVARHLLP